MTSKDLRNKYFEFFKAKGHSFIPSASIIPENDPTVLFTTAGMHPLVPFLMGEKHPAGRRLVNVQKCIRTGDIEEVGDDWHLTFFEMLGNWSLGDYFKKEAIEWSWEYLTGREWLGISRESLLVTVFEGDDDAPFDEEAYNIWKNQGVPESRIYKFPKSENWWGPAGKTGPCGPDTEMFFDTGRPYCEKGAGPKLDQCNPSCSCGKFLEIWNDVFMQFNKTAKGEYQPLKQRNVDTGMGLERIVAVMNQKENVYEIDINIPIISEIESIAPDKENNKAKRIIADHIKSAVMIMGDDFGIAPSNIDQGYVVRRLIRRAIRYGKELAIEGNFVVKIAEAAIESMKDNYHELAKNADFIKSELKKEEARFNETIKQGEKEFKKMSNDKKISGKEAFILFSTYGFPFELTRELSEEKGYKIDENEFKEEMGKHQDLSRTASAGKFSGGLADHSEQVTKYHTATHLLHAALRRVLGDHVFQKGSNITEKRLRFDFSHNDKITKEQLEKVEKIVNDQIKKSSEVTVFEMGVEEAKKSGAIGVFDNRYGDKVKVYSIGDFSKEICGGPHAKNIGNFGKFRIIKEQSSSSGVRRIKAVLE